MSLIHTRGTGNWFHDFPSDLQRKAAEMFDKKFHELGGRVSTARQGLWVASIRSTLLHPEKRASEWGRMMRRKLLPIWGRMGGLVAQAHYRRDGKVGRWHPLAYARAVKASQQKWRKQKEREQELARQGVPAPDRVYNQPLTGI